MPAMCEALPTSGGRESRHLLLAEAITGEDPKRVLERLRRGRILLTGDPTRLRTHAGRLMLRVAANAVSRFCPTIDLCLGESLAESAAEARRLILDIDRNAEVRVVSDVHGHRYAAVLSVGRPSWTVANLITIDAAGWLALLSNGTHLPAVGAPDDDNPLGAMAAAALGAAEVFKLLLRPVPERAGLYGDLTFSTFAYDVGTRDAGPRLPGRIGLPPSLLAGVGAVGNAFLMALREIPGVAGELVAVDRECLDDPSNLNRYALAREDDVRLDRPAPKTGLATRLFAGTSISVRSFQQDVEDLARAIDRGTVRPPQVVLSAVDNDVSRRALQDLWPDLLLEGATAGSMLQISRCDYQEGLACLECLHPIEKDGGSCDAEGRPTHSAVSFVSLMTGVLLAAEYLKHVVGARSRLRTLVQLDLMFPLDPMLQTVRKTSRCRCVRDRDGIARHRTARGATVTASA
jgi:molybdopterin/thiamine biosynthesis adenylyltransferase